MAETDEREPRTPAEPQALSEEDAWELACFLDGWLFNSCSKEDAVNFVRRAAEEGFAIVRVRP